VFGPPQKPLLWTEKNRKALALLCLTSGLQPNAANPSESMIRELLSCDKDGCFSSKNVFGPSQKPWLWTAKNRRYQLCYVWRRHRCQMLGTRAMSSRNRKSSKANFGSWTGISFLELFAPHFYSIDISYNNRFAKYGIYGILLPTVGLPWDSPPPPPESVRTDVRTYADVTTKISRIDRLTDLLLYGAPLVRCARGLRYKVSWR